MLGFIILNKYLFPLRKTVSSFKLSDFICIYTHTHTCIDIYIKTLKLYVELPWIFLWRILFRDEVIASISYQLNSTDGKDVGSKYARQALQMIHAI